MIPTIFLTPGKRHRILQGHPWVFKTEIARAEGEPVNGETVTIRDHRGNLLGSGIYNAQSQITVRRYATRVLPLDRALIAERISAAVQRRKSLTRSTKRLFWSESDGLPGLVVDQYGDVVVLQTLTLALAKREAWIVEVLQELLQPSAILARNDAPVRRLEGLPLERHVLAGNYEPPTEVTLDGLTYALDLWQGQKTGFYLDQVENYAAVARVAQGKRVLDCFTNQGGFALAAMRAGASSCRAIDQSAEALALGRKTAERHGLKIDWVQANVFDELRVLETAKEKFEVVILDPPSFTKSKAQVEAAMRGYRDLHWRALRLLSPGGLLASFCCSHSVTEEMWREMLREAAVEAGVNLRVRERLTQGTDHPILLAVPETEYLRGYVLELI